MSTDNKLAQALRTQSDWLAEYARRVGSAQDETFLLQIVHNAREACDLLAAHDAREGERTKQSQSDLEFMKERADHYGKNLRALLEEHGAEAVIRSAVSGLVNKDSLIRWREREPSPIHGLSVADGDLADYLWRVLDYYANPYSYIGERTGGILQGCPRGPNPTAQEMTHEAEIAKRRLKSAYDAAQQAAQPQPSVAEGFLLVRKSDLIGQDSYGVHGSEFYYCRICGCESGAGMLNKGITHAEDCPLAGAPQPPQATT